MNFHRHAALACLAVLVTLGTPLSGRVDAEVISLDFSQNPVLPSASGQGLTFEGSSGVTESSVFSVASGLLHVDTLTSYPSRDVEAGYVLSGYSPNYDSSLDAEMTFRVRVTAAPSFGMFFGYNDAIVSSILSVTTSTWSLYGGPSGNLSGGPSAFHTFDIATTGATHTYTLTIDGVIVSSGAQQGGYSGPSQLFFGDGTPSGGNITGDISSFYYANPAVVPEPSSLALMGLGLAAVAGLAGRRRSRAIGR